MKRISGLLLLTLFALLMASGAAHAQDCNGNSIPDSDDIANGTSIDGDNNGIPDECQVQIEQLNWKNGDDLFLLGGQFSYFGQVNFGFVPSLGPLWGQVIVDGVYVVQNLPLFDINGVGGEIFTTTFDLGNAPGTQVTSVQMAVAITPNQVSNFPPGVVPVQVPVGQQIRRQGGANESGEMDYDPDLVNTPPDNFINFPFFFPWEITIRPGMPNLNVKWNHCAPGAVANSFECLKSRLGLPLNQTHQEIMTKLTNEMNTTKNSGTIVGPGVALNDMLKGKKDFVQEKQLQGIVTTLATGFWYDGMAFDPLKVHQWMKDGYDVEMDYGYLKRDGTKWAGGHAVVIAGTIKCGDNLYFIVRSDHDQHLKTFQSPTSPGEKPGGVSKWDVHCVVPVGSTGEFRLTNEANNRIRGAIANCVDIATPTLLANFAADAGTDFVSLSFSLPDERGLRGINVYRSLGSSGDFQRISEQPIRMEGLGNYRFRDDVVDPGTMYTYELGLVELDGAEVRVGRLSVQTLQANFAMSAPRPNPTRLGFALRVSTPVTGPATVRVLDAQGRIVHTIFQGTLSAGDHTLTWNGRLETGRAVGSGIYFVTYDAGGLSTSRRVVIMK